MEKIYYWSCDSSKIYVSSWCFRPFFFQLINELRLRLPLSERDEITSEAKKAAGLTEENYETKRALKVAQATVSSLQVCLLPTYDIYRILGELCPWVCLAWQSSRNGSLLQASYPYSNEVKTFNMQLLRKRERRLNIVTFDNLSHSKPKGNETVNLLFAGLYFNQA